VLQYHFHWNHLSAIAGLTWWNFHFRLYSGSINKERAVEFLQHPMRHIPGDILIVWDRLTAHRSRFVREFIEAQEGRIEVGWLPAYAPELNPAEYLWGHLKHHELPNFCPRDLWHLGTDLGQSPPGATPEIFAPGINSRDSDFEHSAAVFSPDGKEVSWCARRHVFSGSPDDGMQRLHFMMLVDGRWTEPQVAPFMDKVHQPVLRPVFSPNGNRLYLEFSSDPNAE
jgi:transposase